MALRNVQVKNIFGITLLITMLHCSIQPSSTSPQVHPIDSNSSNIFSQEFLKTLRPDQDEKKIAHLYGNTGYQAWCATSGNHPNPIAGVLVRDTPDVQWVQTFALDPHNNDQKLLARAIQKLLRASRSGKRPVEFNVVVDRKNELNQSAREAMERIGCKTAFQSYRLERTTSPDTRNLNPAYSLAFRTTANPNADQVRAEAIEIYTQQTVLPQLACTAADVAAYVLHEERTSVAAYVLGAEDNPIPAGAITYIVQQSSDNDRKGIIEMLGVAEKYRNCKIASALIGMVIKQLSKRGIPKVEINVLSTNEAAQRLYNRFGFILKTNTARMRLSANVSPQPDPLQLPPAVIALQ